MDDFLTRTDEVHQSQHGPAIATYCYLDDAVAIAARSGQAQVDVKATIAAKIRTCRDRGCRQKAAGSRG